MNSEDEKLDFPKKEEEILEFWKKNKIFEKSVEQRKKGKKFVFYEGPPTANGQPGIHSMEARVFKDIILRYKTMAGFYCERRAGWDTHGLPVEIQVEKELGLKSKKDIEEYGIEKFIEKCKESVWRYRNEWEELTSRMAYWLDMENAYATMTNGYMENLWRIFKECDRKKFLYEDYKIVAWCPRCGTALSSHEVSQGYKKIKEDSIYVKFPIKNRPNTYFLVWTTTPWTLPSNVALAINQKIAYTIIEKGGERLILAKSRLSAIEGEYKIGEEKLGVDLLGREYEPLYKNEAPYKIYGGDFVSEGDGTGIVHIAPAFGEDDMKLGKAEKLPVLSLVDEEGKMKTPQYKWNGIFIKDADKMIIEDLKSRNLLYKTKAYEHDYPFCWRCSSPLMYFAKTSWWLKTTAVKKNMIAENKKINWHPEHLQKGRFGEWLNELRDWAISRERYWGTPLPVWRCKNCEKYQVVGSLKELKEKTVKSGNKYFLMRHGFAEHNLHNISSSSIENDNYNLLPKGKKEIAKTAAKLKKEKIDLIISSDFLRTKETAKATADVIGIPQKNIIFDSRLRDVNAGIFGEKPQEEYHEYFSSTLEKFSKIPPAGENLTELKNRLMNFLYEAEEKYKNRNILIVSHEYPIWLFNAGAGGLTNEEAVELKKKNNGERGDFIKTGEARKLEFAPLPHDKNYVLDLHRPYIDKIFLKCDKCLPGRQAGGNTMERVKDVCDVWFDSGAMPFASHQLDYPADYICEAIDQTRGWFYTLLAVASLLGKKSPYKNILSLGLVLDKSGQKMSKSRGNIVVPKELMDKYGADSTRWYFYTINQPWDEKLFKEEDVAATLRRFILIFWNCFEFWKTYSGSGMLARTVLARIGKDRPCQCRLIINKWVLAKFNQVVGEVSTLLDDYDIVSAARLIENFILEDFSRWYIRRIREIMKDAKSKEAKETRAVLGFVLLNTAKLLAPFLPFISETIYRKMKGENKSVHLDDFPGVKKISVNDKKLLKEMEIARDIVAKALELRARAGIKVRQPLSSLKIKIQPRRLSGSGLRPQASEISSLKDKEILDLIKGEVNVKEIIYDKNIKNEIEIDTVITPELKEEGILRELIRQLQDVRKKEGCRPSEMVVFYISADGNGRDFLVKYAKEIKKSANAKSIIVRASMENGQEIKTGGFIFSAKIEK